MEAQILEPGANWPRYKDFPSIEELIEYSKKNPRYFVGPRDDMTRVYRCGELVEAKK